MDICRQFLSPDTNLRDDEYGGSFENRLRFIRELYEAVKAAIGNDIVVGVGLKWIANWLKVFSKMAGSITSYRKRWRY